MARQLSVPFAGERVTTSNRRTWLRLTASGAVLFGPGRAALIYAGRRGNRRLLHTMERRWARAASAALGMQIDIRGLDLVDRAREETSLPLAVGFGISQREHVVDVCRKADAAVVGSALMQVMLESPRNQLIKRARGLVAELAGNRT